MNWVSTARDVFALHYFDWCVSQIHFAANDNFRMLKQIEGYYSGILSDFVDAFGASEGARLCLAHLKKSSSRVLELRGEAMTTSDQESLARFADFSRVGGVIMRVPSARHKLLLDTGTDSTDTVETTALRRFLVEYLSVVLGAPIRRGAREFLEFRTNISDWVIFTNISAEEGSRRCTLRYSHTISARSSLDAEVIGASISYLAWLGLPATEWDVLASHDLRQIASSLRDFVDVFLRAAPTLLKGIENPLKIV